MGSIFLYHILQQFSRQLQENGCLEVTLRNGPNLKNDIHPLFAMDRWARGYDQKTSTFYHRMTFALRLASLMISEDCMLSWFSHLTFGRQEVDADPRRGIRTFIAKSEYERTSRARKQIMYNLRRLAKVTSIMFTPRKYAETEAGLAYGATYRYKPDCEWYTQFSRSDWPHIDDQYRTREYAHRGRPLITLNAGFQDFFFLEYEKASASQKLRVHFLLAITLVHECTHAYWFFLGRKRLINSHREPFWHRNDTYNELGFSWETFTLGRIMDVPWGYKYIRYGSLLCSLQELEFAHQEERRAVMRHLFENRGMVATKIPLEKKFFKFACGGWAGSKRYTIGERCDAWYLSVIHGIPMSWIQSWFSEEEWNKRRRLWESHRLHGPPSLGPTFVLVYRKNPSGEVMLHYHTRVDVDLRETDVRTRTAQMGLYQEDDANPHIDFDASGFL